MQTKDKSGLVKCIDASKQLYECGKCGNRFIFSPPHGSNGRLHRRRWQCPQGCNRPVRT
jgi:hypothetical protein